MGALMINVKIDLAESRKTVETGCITKNADGSLSMGIGLTDAMNIDNCENAVLRVVYPSIRSALSEHLSAVSEKKATKRAGKTGEIFENVTPYRVDGEAGRFTFTTHSVREDGQVVYNTASVVFNSLNGKEYHKTVGYKELAFIYGDTEESFRKTGALINRIRHQKVGGTPFRTLRANTEKEGKEVNDFIEREVNMILKENGFTKEGEYCGNDASYADYEPVTINESMISQATDKFLEKTEIAIGKNENVKAEMHANPVCYEDVSATVNVSADDVNSKRQASKRPVGGSDEKGKRKYVHNTVIEVTEGDRSYILNGFGIGKVICYLIAFLFNNNLIGKRIQFFTDGHTILNKTIIRIFEWYPNMGIILDWYHLVWKCKEQLSMGMKGRDVRNAILKQMMPFLWLGQTDRAIRLLSEIKDTDIKSGSAIEKLKAYLERNSPYIPCYVIRKELGLRNSSNRGEKANDLVVSDRQKHNGMSWSKKGSVALAFLSALKRNCEYMRWFEKREIKFKFAT